MKDPPSARTHICPGRAAAWHCNSAAAQTQDRQQPSLPARLAEGTAEVAPWEAPQGSEQSTRGMR